MRGYWHIIAISVIAALLFQLTQSKLLLIIYFIWLLSLYWLQRCPFFTLIAAIFIFLILNIVGIETFKEEPSIDYLKKENLKGKITSEVKKTDKLLRFNVKPNNFSSSIQATYFLKNDNDLENTPVNDLKYGANCIFTGKYEEIELATNPGQFDFKAHLESQDVIGQYIISEPSTIFCKGSSKLQFFYEKRQQILHRIENRTKPNTSIWIKALLIGDKTDLPEDIVSVFQRWSLSHILAISGLHVGLLISITYFLLLKSNFFTKENVQWFLICFLPIYAVIAGGAPSVWRSSLMAFIVLVLAKLNINLVATDIVSIVFITLLLINPNMIFQIGFQFSFLVSATLILSRKWIIEGTSFFIQLTRISFLSQMVIIPIQVLYFYQLQPLSILLNILVIPYFSFFVIPLLFIILFFIWIPIPIVVLFEKMFTYIHQPFLKLLNAIDQIFDMPFFPGEISILMFFIYYIIFFCLLLSLQFKKQFLAFLSGCGLVLLLSSLALRPYISSVGTVTMLDIGQGDAFVVELPYRKGVILIDVGSTFSFENMEPSDKVYKTVIAPYLHSKGIKKLDAVFLSHEHIDHDGSLLYMFEDFKIDRIIVSPIYKPTQKMTDAWKEYSADVYTMKASEQVNIKGQSFYALAPLVETNSANENSLVLYTDIGGKGFIFTGDIGVDTERQIIEAYPNLKIDVLKVGHHGSNTSTSSVFLEHYRPTSSLISSGRKNSFGHPTQDVINTLKKQNILIYRTDKQGAVQYNYTEKGGVFETFLP